jgi:hypothetical protein
LYRYTMTQAEAVEAELEAEVRGARMTLRRVRGLPNQVILPATPPAGGITALPKDVVSTLEVWGLSPQALEAELHAELGGTLGAGAAAAAGRRRPDAAERKTAAILGGGCTRSGTSLNPFTHSLNAPWVQPLSLHCVCLREMTKLAKNVSTRFLSSLFQTQLVPLRLGLKQALAVQSRALEIATVPVADHRGIDAAVGSRAAIAAAVKEASSRRVDEVGGGEEVVASRMQMYTSNAAERLQSENRQSADAILDTSLTGHG